MISFAIVHPLDTLRTRIQSENLKAVPRSSVSSLTRGFLVSILWAGPQGGLRFGTYEVARDNFDIPVALSAVAGDLASTIVKIPREVLTQNMQSGRYSNTFHAVRDIGLIGLFRGGVATELRDIPFMVILFTTYDMARHVSGRSEPVMQILSGGVSGALAAAITTPADVVKTRIMTSTEHPPPSTWAVWMRAYKERALFSGVLPRSAWWFFVCSTFFPLYESFKAAVHRTGNDVNHG